jgi:hypothetical protein
MHTSTWQLTLSLYDCIVDVLYAKQQMSKGARATIAALVEQGVQVAN